MLGQQLIFDFLRSKITASRLFLDNFRNSFIELAQEGWIYSFNLSISISSLLGLEPIRTLMPLYSAHEATALTLSSNNFYWAIPLEITKVWIHIQAILFKVDLRWYLCCYICHHRVLLMIISLGLVHGTAKAMLMDCILLLSDKLAEVLHLGRRRIANVAWHLLISIT